MAGKEIDTTTASATAAATEPRPYLALQMMMDSERERTGGMSACALSTAKQNNDAGDQALHVALKHKAEWKYVRACLEAFPDGAKQPNASGLPLHCAMAHENEIDSVGWVLRAYPQAAAEPDINGDLPVHLALTKHTGVKKLVNWQNIGLVLSRYPEALRIAGSEALNPFELAMIVRLANQSTGNTGQDDDKMIAGMRDLWKTSKDGFSPVESVTITRESKTEAFGLVFGGPADAEQQKDMPGIYIRDILDDTRASSHPRLRTMLGWNVTTVNGVIISKSTVTMLYSYIANCSALTLGLVNDRAVEQFYSAKGGQVSYNVMRDQPPREQPAADAGEMRVSEQAATGAGAAPAAGDGGDSGPALSTAAGPGAEADPRVLHVDLINLWDQPEQKNQLAAATDTISLANVVTMEQWRQASLSWSDCATESSAGPRTLDMFGCIALCGDSHDDVLQAINPFALRSLEKIHLGGNALTMLPAAIGNFTNLRELNAEFNCLTKLPDEIKQLRHLENLKLHSNKLTELPDVFDSLDNLLVVQLGCNELVGLPDSFASLVRLRWLSLYNNFITEVPVCLDELMGSLRALDLTNNKLEGQLDPITTFFPRLQHLRVGNNQLTAIPDSICQLKDLQCFSANTNLIEAVPSTIGQLEALTHLRLEKNRLTRLPVELFGLKNLVVLNASNNRLTSIPHELGTLTQLSRLWLSGNSLGSLPFSIVKLKRLSEFTIHGNMLTELHPAMGQMGRLQKLRISADDHVCSEYRLPLLWPHIDVVSSPSGRTAQHIKMLKRRATKLMKQQDDQDRAVAAATPDERNIDDLLADIMGDTAGAQNGKPKHAKKSKPKRTGEMSDLERYLSSIAAEPAAGPVAGNDTPAGPKKPTTKKKKNKKKK